MKPSTLVCLTLLFLFSFQLFSQIPGNPIEGPIVLFDTLTVKKGDIIYLGKGSDPETGGFIHLYAPKNKTANTLYNIFSNDSDLSYKVIPQMNLEGSFAGSQLVVESFSMVTSKKKVNKILGVINMKTDQFTEGMVSLQGDVFLNNVIVDFEPAIKSGEILKISTPVLTEKALEDKLLFPPFEMTSKGIAPVVVAINNLSKNELYNKTLIWINSYYQNQNQATITSIPDEKNSINSVAKNVKFTRLMGQDVFVDVPYMFTIDFTDGEITMSFTLGDENGDITDEHGEVIASTSHMFNKNGEPYKMVQVFKAEAEKVMNDLSYALVDYLMN